MMKYFLIALSIVVTLGFCLDILSNKINKKLSDGYLQSQNDIKLLLDTLNHIHYNLKFLRFKNCPEEEYKNISLEILNFLDEIVKTDKFKVLNGEK